MTLNKAARMQSQPVAMPAAQQAMGPRCVPRPACSNPRQMPASTSGRTSSGAASAGLSAMGAAAASAASTAQQRQQHCGGAARRRGQQWWGGRPRRGASVAAQAVAAPPESALEKGGPGALYGDGAVAKVCVCGGDRRALGRG